MRKMVVPVYTRTGGNLMYAVEVTGTMSQLGRLTRKLMSSCAMFHDVGEPKVQTANEFLRRHPELRTHGQTESD